MHQESSQPNPVSTEETEWKKAESPLTALKRLAGFLAMVVVGALVSHFTKHGDFLNVEAITSFAGRLGHWGPLFILAAGIITPLFFLPRWPLAFLGGLLYGLFWGTLLATFASTLGAWLHFSLSKTLLSPMTDRLMKRYRIERFRIPQDKEFSAVFLMRAFPLSSFVVTNLIAGALRLKRGKFVLASFLGMIPSSLLYAAGGKLLKKPDPHFYWVAGALLLAIVVGTVFAEKAIHRWQKSREAGAPPKADS